MSSIDITDQHVHLWTTAYLEITDELLLKRYYNLLSHREVEVYRRFHFPKDQRQYLVTRALLKTVLSCYHTDVQKTDWVFKISHKGKPSIANQSVINPVQFNLAHTDGLIVLAITKHSDIGVDVENINRSGSLDEIADRYFSSNEKLDLSNLPEAQKQKGFFELWTLKESYIKARGLGLSIPLDQISFELNQTQNINFTFNTNLNDSAQSWKFWQFMYAQNYIIAVAIQSSGYTGPFEISFKNCIPLSENQTYFIRALRRSK